MAKTCSEIEENLHCSIQCTLQFRCAKKVVSSSPGLVDFATGLANSLLNNLPNGQVKFFEEFKLQKKCVINPAHPNVFGAR